MKKTIFIVGPTATGKTDLALMLAPKISGILINADSRQIYKSLNIISGKDLDLIGKTPVYLLDVVDPDQDFNVFNFIKIAIPLINRLSEGYIPIVVGGSGLYIKALENGINTSPPNLKLREELNNLKLEELQKKLKDLNLQKFEKMNSSDKANKRRVVRAIEIILAKGQKEKNFNLSNFNILKIGLFASREYLKKRIDERIEKRLKNGAIDEAKKLFKNYRTLSEQVKTSPGYRELFSYLKKEKSLDEAIGKWKISEYQLSKKQMTWFKKDKNINWFDITEKGFDQKIQNLVIAWYNKPYEY